MKIGIAWLAIATTASLLGAGGCTVTQTISSAPPLIEPTPEMIEEADPAPSLGDRDDYRPFDITTLPPDADLTGNDPEAIALKIFGASEPTEGPYQEEIRVDDSNPEQPVVILTQMGLADDSVKGIKYRLDFEPATQQEWRLTWAGQQYVCYRGSVGEEWQPDLCP
ncbi:MAG: hypothetical protein VKK04_01720 [Synechococcales bacterium]|nr:hypothetical protein [Synechococcales bacterium]